MDAHEANPLTLEQEIVKKTLKGKLKCLQENITVEPILVCYFLPYALVRLANQNLNIDKACRVNIGYGDKICGALIAQKGEMYVNEELAIQELIAKIESIRNIFVNAVPIVLILFIGAWSDKTGKRKFVILLPIYGELLLCLSNILSVYFYYEWPVEVVMSFEAILPAITGGWIIVIMGTYSHVSNIIIKESLTFRIGILDIVVTLAAPTGTILGGILLGKIGYYAIFSLSTGFYVFGIIYGSLFIKDPERSTTENLQRSSSVWSSIKSFFDISHVTDTVKVAFKNEPKGRRTKFILILISIMFISGPYDGEDILMYMFTRYCFGWDAQMYSFYNVCNVVIHMIGAMILVIWCSHRLKWDDSVLGIISTISKIIGSIAVTFASNTKDMYVAVILDTLNGTAFTVLRSALSKLGSNDELGKMTALFNLVELAGSMSFESIYSTLYLYTISIEPRIVFHASAVFTVLPLVVFGLFYVQHRKALSEHRRSYIEGFVDTS